jgi:hypothetical protein
LFSIVGELSETILGSSPLSTNVQSPPPGPSSTSALEESRPDVLETTDDVCRILGIDDPKIQPAIKLPSGRRQEDPAATLRLQNVSDGANFRGGVFVEPNLGYHTKRLISVESLAELIHLVETLHRYDISSQYPDGVPLSDRAPHSWYTQQQTSDKLADGKSHATFKNS